MRIGVTCHASAGGSGILATELGMAVAERGHEVHFIGHERPVRLRGDERVGSNLYFHQAGTAAYPVFSHPPQTLTLAAKMVEVAQCYELDLLHLHYALPHATAAYLAKQILGERRQLCTVTTLHGTDITLVGMHPSIFDVTRFSILASDSVTAVSRWLEARTREIFEVDKDITVIPNFVDTDHFRPLEEHPMRGRFAKPGEKIVMHASNFRAVKNITTVIDVFARLSERVSAKLLLIGEGPERRVADERAREHQITERVMFLGSHEFVEQFLPLADLFLLPSWHESFGLVALEAMSTGIPVIATNVGGTVEVITDGDDGFLVAPDDVTRMAQIARELLTDADRARRIARAARETAVTRFAKDLVVDKYLALYESVCRDCDGSAARRDRSTSR
jgi:N-acetyl-alpha-D-glucosaminyl L-malate synthase BshA